MSAVLFSHTVGLRLILLAIGASLVFATWLRDRAGVRLLPPLWLPFALWACWAFLSLAWSVEPERSVRELRNEVGYTALAFCVCYVAAQARNAVRVIAPLLAAAALLACGLAFYHFSQGNEPYQRGWHGGPGNFSSALLTLMPCAILAAWHGYRTGRTAACAAGSAFALLFAAAAFTTLNRTIWFGFALQLLVIGAALVWRARLAIGPAAKAASVLIAACLFAGAAFVSSRILAEREPNSHSPASSLAHDWRLKLWPEMLKHAKVKALSGYGFGRGLFRESLQDEFRHPLFWHAHNYFLDTLVQVGVPGILLLLILLGATLREGWRSLRSADDFSAACGLAVIAIVVGMIVRNMTDTLLIRQNALLYWGMMGLLLAWGRAPRSRPGN